LNLFAFYEGTQVNTLDIEQVRKILHTCSSSWYNTTG